MNASVQWTLVALALLVVVTRRRSVAILLVGMQAVLLGVGALLLTPGRPWTYLVAALILLARGVPLFFLLTLTSRRTREPRPLGLQTAPLLRGGGALAAALAIIAVMPRLGLETVTAEHAGAALLTIGIAVIVSRRGTIFHALGLLTVENAVALAAVNAPGGLPLVVELGIAVDLTIVIAVAIAFHERIFDEFGTGDTHVLRSLHD